MNKFAERIQNLRTEIGTPKENRTRHVAIMPILRLIVDAIEDLHKRLADQPTRPACLIATEKTQDRFYCTREYGHEGPCAARPVGASPEDQSHSKRDGEGSIPSAPATLLERSVGTLLTWHPAKFVSVHYENGAVATTDGAFSSYMPAKWKPRIVTGSLHEAHQTAASFDACPECNPKRKMDHLPEGSH